MKKLTIFAASALTVVLTFAGVAAADQSGKTPTSASRPSDRDIANAAKQGKVWFDPTTKQYRKAGDRYYGTTNGGKFMSESDAQKLGARPAKFAR
jgi:hypothetical protein